MLNNKSIVICLQAGSTRRLWSHKRRCIGVKCQLQVPRKQEKLLNGEAPYLHFHIMLRLRVRVHINSILYPWLEYFRCMHAAFCFPCPMFPRSKAGPVLVTKRFWDWKLATGRKGVLSLHNICSTHKCSVIAWEQLRLNQTKGSHIRQRVERVNHLHMTKENQHYMKRSFYFSFMILALAKVPCFNEPFLQNNARHSSPDAQNDVLTIMGTI